MFMNLGLGSGSSNARLGLGTSYYKTLAYGNLPDRLHGSAGFCVIEEYGAKSVVSASASRSEKKEETENVIVCMQRPGNEVRMEGNR